MTPSECFRNRKDDGRDLAYLYLEAGIYTRTAQGGWWPPKIQAIVKGFSFPAFLSPVFIKKALVRIYMRLL